MKTYSVRFTSGQDIKLELDRIVRAEEWSAACILTGVGSLHSAAIRFADSKTVEILQGPLEIVSLGGTLSPDGSHIHILVCDGDGVPKGGHLKEGAVVNTTAEIVLGILEGWEFSRGIDHDTGCTELSVRRIVPEANE